MKRLLRIFELSKNEQRVILIVMLVLITIAFVGYVRRIHHSHPNAPSETQVKGSPTRASLVQLSVAEVSAKPKPTSATVVVVPSGFDTFMLQTGNIQVTFSDGHSELLTAEGDCISPRISSNGDIGWVRVDKSKVDFVAKNREGEDEVTVQLADGKRKEFAANLTAPFIGNWSFADGNSAVAIQSSAYHGPRFYRKYDLVTGKLVDEITAYVPYNKLPVWAKQISDEGTESVE
jgi:hypothetical protein